MGALPLAFIIAASGGNDEWSEREDSNLRPPCPEDVAAGVIC